MRFKNEQVRQALRTLRENAINVRGSADAIARTMDAVDYYPREVTLPKLARRRKILEEEFQKLLAAHDELVRLHKK
jgi:small-conductance mechanosensitive channel